MIPFIGDISKADAEVLKNFAEISDNILEFGCGASTQVMAKYKRKGGSITSIDTDHGWIYKTKSNIQLLSIPDIVDYYEYNDFLNNYSKKEYDFIFDDGVDSLRREFAIKIWPHLKVGGLIAFHDTRRGHDFRNVLEVLAHFQDEIDHVFFNAEDSNITCVYKKKPAPYDNWQISENKKPWMLGYEEPDINYIKSRL
jgi:predicted O-methyltransferase YrrM